MFRRPPDLLLTPASLLLLLSIALLTRSPANALSLPRSQRSGHHSKRLLPVRAASNGAGAGEGSPRCYAPQRAFFTDDIDSNLDEVIEERKREASWGGLQLSSAGGFIIGATATLGYLGYPVLAELLSTLPVRSP